MRKVLLFLAWLIPALCLAQGVDYPTDRSADDALNLAIHQSSPTADFDPDSPTELEPLVHLTLDDTGASTAIVDKSGNYAGTSSRNAADFDVAAGSCKVGTCLDFNAGGTADKVALGDLGGLTTFSACFWHNAGSYHASISRFLDVQALGASQPYWGINNSNVLYFGGPSGTATWANVGQTGVWQHLCIVRAGSNITPYINSIALETKTGATEPIGTTYLGNRSDDVRPADGLMDDIRIYDRVLTPNEIQAIYNAGSGHQRQDTGANRGAIVVDSSNRIGAWVDKVQRIEAAQSDDAKKPVFATLNGRRVVSFDGSDDYLPSSALLSSITTLKQKSFLAVAEYLDTNDRAILGRATGFGETIFTGIPDGSSAWYLYDGGADTISVVTPVGPYIFSGVHDGTNAKFRAKTTTFGASGNTTGADSAIEIGATNGASSYYKGRLGRLLTYNKVLPTSVLQPIERSLARKYGVSLQGATAEQSCEAFFASKTPTLYLDSSDLSTITKDVNNKVSEWRSKIGAVTFTQSGADTLKPTWVGGNVVFDGGDELGSTATWGDLVAANAKTIFIVGTTALTTNAERPFIYGAAAPTRLASFGLTQYASSIYVRNSDDDGAGYDQKGQAGYTANVIAIAEAVHDGTNMSVCVNGTCSANQASGNTTAAGLAEAVTIGGITGETGTYLTGSEQVVLVDNSVWTADERARARSCLGEKYGVTF